MGNGRHVILQNNKWHTTVIQANFELGKNVLKKILNQAKLGRILLNSAFNFAHSNLRFVVIIFQNGPAENRTPVFTV